MPAAFAVALLVVGQLLALSHEARTRHVECAQHGEQLEAATLVDSHACNHDHWVGVEGDGGGDHVDCAIGHFLHQSTSPSRAPLLVAPHVAQASHAVTPSSSRDGTTTVYRIAPKTSPPESTTASRS